MSDSATHPRSGFLPYHVPGTREFPWEFRVAIPARCRPVPGPPPALESGAIIVPLVRCSAAAPAPLEASVSLALLPREMGAGDFAVIAAERSGLRVLDRRDRDGGGAGQAELLVRRPRGDEAWLTWMRVVKDGPRVFRVEASAPEAGFEAVADACRTTARSFELLNPEAPPAAEELAVAGPTDDFPFSFRHPASWRRNELDAGDGRGRVLDLVSGGQVRGTLRVEIKPRRGDLSLQDHARAFAARLDAQGVRRNGAPILPAPPPDGFREAFVFAPPATLGGQAVAAGLSLLGTDDAWVGIEFLTPARRINPWAWAMTKRTFEIVRGSLAAATAAGGGPVAGR